MNNNYTLRFKKNIRFSHSISLVLLLKDGRLAFVVENLILIYNCKNFKCELIIKGNKNHINILEQFPNGKLITCAREIKIYNLLEKQYYCEHTYILNDFEDWGGCALLTPISNEMMVVKSETSFLFINCNPPYNITKEVKSKETGTVLYKTKERNLLFLSCDIHFKSSFWDINKYKKIISIKNIGCSSKSSLFEKKNKLIVCQGWNSQNAIINIFIINLVSLTIELRIEWNQFIRGQLFEFTEIDDNIFFFTGSKGVYITSPLGYNFKRIKWKSNRISTITKIKKFQIITTRKRNATLWIINR